MHWQVGLHKVLKRRKQCPFNRPSVCPSCTTETLSSKNVLEANTAQNHKKKNVFTCQAQTGQHQTPSPVCKRKPTLDQRRPWPDVSKCGGKILVSNLVIFLSSEHFVSRQQIQLINTCTRTRESWRCLYQLCVWHFVGDVQRTFAH